VKPSRSALPSYGVWLACTALALGCAGGPRAQPRTPAEPPQIQLTTGQLLEVAAVLEARGDGLRAGQYLSLALDRGAAPDSVVPRLLALYVRDGQYRLAIDLAENHLRRHPRDLRTRFVLGSLYVGLGLPQAAAEQYARVVGADPQRAEAHFALASLLHDEGQDLARADAHYRAYLRLAPEGPHAEEARAALLTELP
jgi:tetratricopeptide (TPR) repeat protein